MSEVQKSSNISSSPSSWSHLQGGYHWLIIYQDFLLHSFWKWMYCTKTWLHFYYCQIYHGSLGAVAVAVRNISSSSANFASAGKLSSRTWNKLFFCLRSTIHCNLLTQEWHTSVESNCLGGWSFMTGYSKNLSRFMYCTPCCFMLQKLQ